MRSCTPRPGAPSAGAPRPALLRPAALAALALACAFSLPASAQEPGPLPAGASLGTVSDREGSASLRRLDAERWILADERTGLQPGDWVKTATRGANALALRFGRGELLLGPGTLIELKGSGELRLLRGELRLSPGKGEEWRVHGPQEGSQTVAKRAVLRAAKGALTRLERDPKWLVGYEGHASTEAMGSLLAQVDGREVALTMGYHKVQVDIRDQIARTIVEESFVNHTSSVLEGVFYFPLPPGASISGFSMWIGDEQVHGEIVEKQRARAIYETILREKRDPGLLEWAGGNVFKARVYPIGHEKRIRISYTQVLPKEGDAYRYHYALRSEMLRRHPLSKLELSATISSSAALTKVHSPSHPGRLQATEHAARFEFSAEEVTPERDFELAVTTQAPEGGRATFVPHQRADEGYFLCLVDAPPAPARTGPAPPVDLIVIADTSASVEGPAREAMVSFCESLLGSLGPKDRFDLLTVDTELRWAHGSPQAPEQDAIQAALAHLEAREPLGWSDLDPAFAAAFARATPTTQIVYVGDAAVTTGAADPVAFAARVKALHAEAGGRGSVHVVRPGSQGEDQAIKALASLGDGSARSLGESDPAAAAAELLEELGAPKLRDLKVRFEGLAVAAVYPPELPNLPLGSQQIVVGRFLPAPGQELKARIQVRAEVGGQPFQRETAVAFTTSPGDGNSFVPRLWARQHLDQLLAEGRSKSVQERIVGLSEDFQIMTPYTSFLVLESDADRERFKVQKRFRMRDGEEFFAQGREDADYALRQQALKQAKRWRLHLRARVLERLEDMNRQLVDLLRPGSGANLQLAAQGETITVAGVPKGAAGGKFKAELGQQAGRARGMRESEALSDAPGFGGEGADGAPQPSAAPAPPADDAAPAAPMEAEPQAEFDKASEELSDLSEQKRSRAPRAESRLRRQVAGKRVARDGLMRTRQPGLSPYAAAELARLGFLPVENAPPPPSAWPGFLTLFPGVPDRASERTPLQAVWPEDVQKAFGALDRRGWLAEQERALSVVSARQRTDLRGRVHPGGEGRAILGAGGWAQESAHLPGDDSLLSWAFGEAKARERGALRVLWRVGRTRPAEAADLVDYPNQLPWLLSDHARAFGNHEAEVLGRAEGKLTIRFRAPAAQRRWAAEVEVVIDVEREVVLEVRTRRYGRPVERVVYGGFATVLGKTWPTTETRYDGEGVKGWVTTWTLGELPADAAAAARRELVSRREEGTLIGPLPGFDAARQAVERGTPTLEDRLVALSLELGQQRWEEATPAVEALFDRIGDAPARPLFRATWFSQRRRLEALRGLITAELARLQAGPLEAEVARAQELQRWSGALARSERLVLYRGLRPVYVRQKTRIEPAYPLEQAIASFLAAEGREEEAFALLTTLSKDYPFNVSAQQQYAQALVNRAEPDRAVAHLEERLAQGGPWTAAEASALREAIASTLWRAVRYRALVETITGWDAAGVTPPLSRTHYERLLAALLMLDREDEVDARIAAWLEAIPADGLGGEEVVWRRARGAVYHLLGRVPGISMRGGRIPPARQKLLAGLVGRLLSAKEAYGAEPHQRPWDLGREIALDWNFRRTDAAQPLGAALWAELQGGVSELAPERVALLCNLLRGVGYAPAENREAEDGQPAAGWPALFEAIYSRWERTPLGPEAEALQGLILSYARTELQLQCRRGLLKRAENETRRRQRRAELYHALLAVEWTQAREDELQALYLALAPGEELKGEAREEALNAWIARLHDLHDWLLEARVAAAFAALPERNQLDRRQVKARRDALLLEARGALRDRLLAAKDEGVLAPWRELEALWLGVKLKKDPKQLLKTARDLLRRAVAGAAAAEGSAARDLRWRIVASRAVAAQLVVLADLPPGDLVRSQAKALRELIEQAMDKKNRLLEWREVLYCFLSVRQDLAGLRTRLAEWFGGGKEVAERRWGRALAAALTEQDELAQAAEILRKIQDELSHEEWRRLADLYQVLDRRDDMRWAQLESWAHQNEWQLRNGLQQDFYQRYQRRGKRVPETLNPEVPLRFLAVLRKSSRPQNHVWILRNYYASTRDFRLLACVPEAALGQSQQGVYELLRGYRQVSQLLQEEATFDQLSDHLQALRGRAKTVVDRRALDLVEYLSARQAAKQRQGGEEAGRQALAALKRAFERASWAEGEALHYAQLLAEEGQLRPSALADEQLRQLRTLLRGEEAGSTSHLQLSAYLAQVEWSYGKHDAALRTLEASLTASRDEAGRLPRSAWNAFSKRIGYLQQRRRWQEAEGILLAEAKRPSDRWLSQQYERTLSQLYRACLQAGGEVSLGTEETLFQRLLARAYADLARASNENEAAQALQEAGSLIFVRVRYRDGRRVRGRGEQRLRADVRDEALALAYTHLPKALERFHHRGSPNMINGVGNVLKQVAGPREALSFQVQRAENERRWLRLCRWDAWSNRGWELARLCHEAGGVYGTDLGKRLLAIVLAAEVRILRDGEHSPGGIFDRDHRYFWGAARGDFLETAMKVAREEGEREEVTLRVSQFLWASLEEHGRAIALLAERHARGALGREGRGRLARYLMGAKRHGEAIPLLVTLVEERPAELASWLDLVRCYHHTGAEAQADQALATAIAKLKEAKAWGEGALAQIGRLCIETRRWERAAELLEDAIKVRTRGRSNRGIGDGTLGGYYRDLARAKSELGDTIGAVDAAAGAIVAWSRSRRQRQRALARLEQVLQQAKDLAAYVKHLDAEVQETGLENPLLRRVLAQVYLSRKEYAAAVTQLRLSLAAKETDEETHRLLIRCYDAMGEGEQAAEQLLALARVRGHEPQLYVELGQRFQKAGQAARAERAYTTLVERQPNEAAAQGALAKVREGQGKLADAAVHWRQVIRVRSDEPEGYIGLARSLLRAGEAQAAQEPLEALRTREWEPRFHDRVRDALRELSRVRPGKKSESF